MGLQLEVARAGFRWAGPIDGSFGLFHEKQKMTSFYPIVPGRRAWVGADLAAIDDLAYSLPSAAVERLFRTATELSRKGTRLSAWGRRQFREQGLLDALQAPFREVRDGRGFAILRWLPVEQAPLDVVKIALWGLGSLLGREQSQSNLGEVVGEVRDVKHLDLDGRACRSSKELSLHTDICDMIALLAVRGAKIGGDSSVASAFSIHNLLLRERHDLLAPLYEGWRNHRRGEQASNEAPITPHRVPVFSVTNDALSIRYVRHDIIDGLRATGANYPQLLEALNVLDSFAERVKFTFRLQPGEILLLNNLTTLHARTAFEDWPEPSRRRLLLRLWLNADGFRAQNPHIRLFGARTGIHYIPSRTSPYSGFN